MPTKYEQHDAAGLILADSYLFNIHWMKDDELSMFADWALEPAHPLYAPPKPNETASSVSGSLRLQGIERLLWRWISIDPAIDATGTADLGNSEITRLPQGLLIAGDWGAFDAYGPVMMTISLRDRD